MPQINQLLKNYHYFNGLRLSEQEDFVILSRGEDVLKVFNATKVTPEIILLEADKYIKDGEK